jgi:hypothetical protein
VLEFLADFSIDARREPLQADGGTCEVTTQTFKTIALVRLVRTPFVSLSVTTYPAELLGGALSVAYHG